MKVIAIKPGFYDGKRRRVGAEFSFDADKHAKKDKAGDTVLPKWLVPATEAKRVELADAEKAESDKAVKAIEASAGPKKGGRKAVTAEPGSDLV